ncbi:glucose-1-phosphate thymidylyltransferase [Abyssisolibacter fermentans]|uniref:glucose-1-phosphate thymidylyltransferase n=1 Tax=Abyssisolibacter fermentans TaxID=1766203 RepID=UPI000829A07C|nr:glucose-1-phosphate thymidylyltransferase [Abyssisolibacter fermentans]
MKALILCGGIGSRLFPITFSLPKQLIPLVNKPLLFYIIDSLIKADINEIGILVNDNMELFKESLKKYETEKIKLEYIKQEKPIGLANAVSSSREFIKDDDFIMILGDNLYDLDIKLLINEFKLNNSNCNLLLKQVDNPMRFGVAKTNNDYVVDVVEKPKIPTSNLAITGIYIFDKNIFAACENIKPSWRGEYEITDAIRWLIQKGYKVTYKMHEGFWKDLGNPQDVIYGNQYLMKGIMHYINGEIDAKSEISGNIIIGENSRIINSFIKGPVIIGNNTIIKNSYIGPYSSICNNVNIINSKLKNSIILEGCIISNIHTIIDSSIVAQDTIIKKSFKSKQSNKFLLGKNSQVELY